MPSIQDIYGQYGITSNAGGTTVPTGGAYTGGGGPPTPTTPVTGTTPTPTPTGSAQDLVTTPAQINLAAGPDLEKLETLVNQINRQGQMSMIPGAQGMEEQSAKNIANLLAGNLDTSWIQNLQSTLAQQYGASGFAPDTNAMSAAALRAMGLQQQQLRSQGEQELAAAYKRFPSYDISQSLLTPSAYASYLAQQQNYDIAQREIAEKMREYNMTYDQATNQYEKELQFKYAQLGSQNQQFKENLQFQKDQATLQYQDATNQLAEKQREFNVTRDTNVLMEMNQLKQQAAQAATNAQIAQQQINAQVWQTALQYMTPSHADTEAIFRNQLPNYVTINQPTTNLTTPQLLGNWAQQNIPSVTQVVPNWRG